MFFVFICVQLILQLKYYRACILRARSEVVMSAGECGDADVEVVEIVRAINITANMTQATYSLPKFTAGAASFLPGDMYKLCWAREATVVSDFAVEIDASMELVGTVPHGCGVHAGPAVRVELAGLRSRELELPCPAGGFDRHCGN